MYFLINEKFDLHHIQRTTFTQDGCTEYSKELTTISVNHRTRASMQKVMQVDGTCGQKQKIMHGVIATGKTTALPTGQPSHTDVSTIIVLLSSTDGVLWRSIRSIYSVWQW